MQSNTAYMYVQHLMVYCVATCRCLGIQLQRIVYVATCVDVYLRPDLNDLFLQIKQKRCSGDAEENILRFLQACTTLGVKKV